MVGYHPEITRFSWLYAENITREGWLPAADRQG
jgi:hypothetical protein